MFEKEGEGELPSGIVRWIEDEDSVSPVWLKQTEWVKGGDTFLTQADGIIGLTAL